VQHAQPAGGSDVVLMQAVAAGDRTAVAELYDRHAAAVYGMAVSVVRDASLAQDVTQDVFVRLWTRAHTFDPQRGTPIGWLVSVARNLALDELRRQRRNAERADRLAQAAPSHPTEHPDPLLEWGWQSDEVLQAIAELSANQRQTVELVYLQGYTLTEVAERLGIAVGTVKSRLHSALVSLRGALVDETQPAGWRALKARD
jgi:RNA polymerase sigma-70 factor, ECF subfamily